MNILFIFVTLLTIVEITCKGREPVGTRFIEQVKNSKSLGRWYDIFYIDHLEAMVFPFVIPLVDQEELYISVFVVPGERVQTDLGPGMLTYKIVYWNWNYQFTKIIAEYTIIPVINFFFYE
jgi:hypothetical protein